MTPRRRVNDETISKGQVSMDRDVSGPFKGSNRIPHRGRYVTKHWVKRSKDAKRGEEQGLGGLSDYQGICKGDIISDILINLLDSGDVIYGNMDTGDHETKMSNNDLIMIKTTFNNKLKTSLEKTSFWWTQVIKPLQIWKLMLWSWLS